MRRYRRKLKFLSGLHKFLLQNQKMCYLPFLVLASYILVRSFKVPSYKLEHALWAASLLIVFLGLFFVLKGPGLIKKKYFCLQKEALEKYPNLYQETSNAKKNWKFFKKTSTGQSKNPNKSINEKDKHEQAENDSGYANNETKYNMAGYTQDFFAGANDSQGVKLRYKELLKIYHPDNVNGDASISAIINNQYKEKLKIVNNEKGGKQE